MSDILTYFLIAFMIIIIGMLSYIIAIVQCIFNRLSRNNNGCNNINSLRATSFEDSENMVRNNYNGMYYGCYRRR